MDHILRWVLGIREFSEDAECILRVDRIRSPNDVVLRDGTRIHKGDWVCDLHLWHERIARLGAFTNPALGAHLRTQIVKSLYGLALYVAIEPEMRDLLAFHARVWRFARDSAKSAETVTERRGGTILLRQPSLAGRAHDFLELFLIQALAWTFNPQHHGRWRCRPKRLDVWMSRRELLRYFAPSKAHFREEAQLRYKFKYRHRSGYPASILVDTSLISA